MAGSGGQLRSRSLDKNLRYMRIWGAWAFCPSARRILDLSASRPGLPLRKAAAAFVLPDAHAAEVGSERAE